MSRQTALRRSSIDLFGRLGLLSCPIHPQGLKILLNPNEVANEMARSHVTPREVIRLSGNPRDDKTGQFEVVGSSP